MSLVKLTDDQVDCQSDRNRNGPRTSTTAAVQPEIGIMEEWHVRPEGPRYMAVLPSIGAQVQRPAREGVDIHASDGTSCATCASLRSGRQLQGRVPWLPLSHSRASLPGFAGGRWVGAHFAAPAALAQPLVGNADRPLAGSRPAPVLVTDPGWRDDRVACEDVCKLRERSTCIYTWYRKLWEGWNKGGSGSAVKVDTRAAGVHEETGVPYSDAATKRVVLVDFLQSGATRRPMRFGITSQAAASGPVVPGRFCTSLRPMGDRRQRRLQWAASGGQPEARVVSDTAELGVDGALAEEEEKVLPVAGEIEIK
ncbi:hypothetical protein GGX14DRAFT_388530 [Mycena pura]|uniref:Uncharacterized protein n=1 Tax=Mycena pura TaxID=153505 RepID=A0AAD6VS99_9AGAR|nr:hypothetical protein GGX14DRAFT_388530 [Mycena pura]